MNNDDPRNTNGNLGVCFSRTVGEGSGRIVLGFRCGRRLYPAAENLPDLDGFLGQLREPGIGEAPRLVREAQVGVGHPQLDEAYAPEKLARAEAGDVVLFFHASWCPSCRGLGSDIEANASSIPEGVTILKVDYDKEAELKKKYGVTYQHTLVQVGADGALIKKWSGSPKLSDLVSEVR